MIYCWEIWCGDFFLGYEYSNEPEDAINKSISLGGVASMYNQSADKLTARLA